jgi:subtilisin family serine protease
MPYLTMSGTSMAAPVVSGTVALMLQANPSLTPNLVKAILQYTAQQYAGYSPLRQGAGFLNSLGAVQLARFYRANQAGSRMPIQGAWSQQITWGNHVITGGYPNPRGNAWSTKVNWGAALASSNHDDNIVWGTDGDDNIVWGTAEPGDNIVWGTEGFVYAASGDVTWSDSSNDAVMFPPEDGMSRCRIHSSSLETWRTRQATSAG